MGKKHFIPDILESSTIAPNSVQNEDRKPYKIFQIPDAIIAANIGEPNFITGLFSIHRRRSRISKWRAVPPSFRPITMPFPTILIIGTDTGDTIACFRFYYCFRQPRPRTALGRHRIARFDGTIYLFSYGLCNRVQCEHCAAVPSPYQPNLT